MRSLTAPFSAGQLVTLAMTFIVVIGLVVGSAYWLSAPTYSLLFADMDSETMAQVVTRLKSLNVPYQLDEGGRGVRVPANRVDELRLDLTAQGPLQSGRIGFEIFDRTAFGATEFQEKVNFRRALEGEIARTVSTLSEVAGARVHVAMGKESVFGEPRPTTASVVLKLRRDGPLSASTVSGITNLVAASVEGLRPEAVVILDTFGRPLAKPQPDDGDPAGAAHLERQQRLEREMAVRVTNLLEPVVGADRVRVNVALDLNPETREQTQEVYDPMSLALRSRQTSSDNSTAGTVPVTPGIVPGTAGARANLPPPAQPPVATGSTAQAPPLPQQIPAGPTSQRTSETVNNEISRTTTRVVQPPGEVSRLSVAVILDDDHVAKTTDGVTTTTRTPRTQEQLKKIEELVGAAVGLDPMRGDRLTVQNIAFEEAPVEQVVEPTFVQRWSPQIEEGSRISVVLVVAALAFFLFVRPVTRRLSMPSVPDVTVVTDTGHRVRTVAELESEIEAQLDATAALNAGANLRLPVLTRRVTETSQKEPEQVARILRGWMAEGER